ncbi:hypothetical protein D3C80_1372210 [compost metagenome]
MRTAFMRVYVVRERINVLAVAVVVLQGNLYLNIILGAFYIDRIFVKSFSIFV